MLYQIRLMVIVISSLILMAGIYFPQEAWIQGGNIFASNKARVLPSEEEPGVYSSYKVDVPPRILNYEEVRTFMGYPAIAKDAGIQGSVVLKVLVNNKGEYVRHEVVEDFHPLLRIPCESFVHYLRFEPARLDQNKVACWLNVPFEFNLESYGK